MQALEQHYEKLKKNSESSSQEAALIQAQSTLELTIEQLLNQIAASERQLTSQVSSNKDVTEDLEKARRLMQKLQDEIGQLRVEKLELGKEIQDSEAGAFKDFCKAAKIKSVREYEAVLYSNDG